MNVLITGINGYAGFHAALAFAAAGHTVEGITRDASNPRLDELRRHQVNIVTGDIARPDAWVDAINRADVFVHTVMDHADPIGSDRALFKTINNASGRTRAPLRFIYTTGCSIHGKVPQLIMDESTGANPDHVLAFRLALEAEALALENIRTVVVRPGFMYGCDGQNSMAARWFAMAGPEPFVFRGDREKGWSWVHIADLARAYVLVAEADRAIDGEVFCLADEQRPKVIDVMQACLDVAQHKTAMVFGERAEADLSSTWFDQNEFITSAKASRLLGWVPNHTGVIDTIGAFYASWRAANPKTVGSEKEAARV
jgi:nucleoside-diphosphate-sugar epimerase